VKVGMAMDRISGDGLKPSPSNRYPQLVPTNRRSPRKKREYP